MNTMKRKSFLMLTALCMLLTGITSCGGGSDDAVEEPTVTPTPTPTPTPDPTPSTDDTPSAVRYKTFKGLVMAGYQAWFNCVGDWTGRGWVHLNSNGGGFKPGATCVEYWPDLTEYTKLYNTPFKMPDGTTAKMFSSADKETIDLHFKWMKQYNIDGAIVQRFKSAVESNPSTKEMIGYMLEAAKKYDRAIMIEYDLSGLGKDQDETLIINDWNELAERYKLYDPAVNPTYVWTDGKPLVGFYAVDMEDSSKPTRYGSPEQYNRIFDALIGRDGKAGACSILAGVGYNWQTGNGDNGAGDLAQWEATLKRCSVISPWAVGRFKDKSSFTARYDVIKSNLEWCNKNNIIYAPVAFPGFSWHNTTTSWSNGIPTFRDDAPYDAIPRNKGDFFWTQLACYIQWGIPSIFIAMFDEMDEGTCIFKCSHKDQTPVNSSAQNPNGKILSYDEDLPTGYYLHLAGSAAKWLKGATGYSQKRPEYVEPE